MVNVADWACKQCDLTFPLYQPDIYNFLLLTEVCVALHGVVTVCSNIAEHLGQGWVC